MVATLCLSGRQMRITYTYYLSSSNWDRQIARHKWFCHTTTYLTQVQAVVNGLFQKNFKNGGLRTYFPENPPVNFRFVTLPLEIPEKNKLSPPWKFYKNVWYPLEIPRPKTTTRGNSTLVFLEHPWKFYFYFNWLLEFPHALSSFTPGNSMSSTFALFGFFLEKPNTSTCRYLSISDAIIVK